MFERRTFVPGMTCLLLLWPAVSNADTLSENFNELTPSLNASNVGAFTVTAGSVDVVGGSLFGNLCVSPESGNCVDLDGTTLSSGQLTSAPLTLTPGTYDLSFDLIGSQRGPTTSTTVTLGSLYDQTFVLSSSDDTDGIVSTVLTVTTPITVPLVFTGNDGASDIGSLLDNVDLKAADATPTPELGTLSLMVVGLVGLVALRKFAVAP